jgi:SPX domain protein involved in polyphosphate accumulation
LAIEAFHRKEKKYVIGRTQYEWLLKHLPDYMRPDKYGTDGCYTVTNLYFDNTDFEIYKQTKNKEVWRRKLRLRVYDDVALHDTAFFELKLKHDKNTLKRRTMLTLADACHYLNHADENPLNRLQTSNTAVLQEIDTFRTQYNLHPKMIVSYRRHAFHGKADADLRITFDSDLRCRKEDLHLENGAYGENFIAQDSFIMEIKTNTVQYPYWLEQLLRKTRCEQKRLSKFCTSMELLHKNRLP